MDKVKCPHCGATTQIANFCTKCGGKLVETCNWWVLEKPYNCRQAKCPALRFRVTRLLRLVGCLSAQQDNQSKHCTCRQVCKVR